ncbi:hypothetical protein EZV62_016975 [Acer yangbiense]|uniref:Helicase C-terminal domain-containing protein n=1 Tax=Acer yangbiense TaxID=1000413 RepID=A0A5C7HSA8_9ROSI|nr:hypothetical protein EZV62_016975 [Acer yangbiense]
MVDVVITVAGKVLELLVVPIGKHILYPFKYKSNMEELTKQVEKLTDQREMVQHSVDEAKRQGDEIEKKVEKWLKSVDEFTEEPIIDDQVKAGKLCSIGFCPNLMARYSLSRKAAKTTKKGVDLLGELGDFDKVSYRPPLQKTTSIYNRGYEDFDSRKQVFNDLMKAVTDTDVNLIGVYGMGGVGKTTLVKRVVGQAIQDKFFDVVVMADVTGTPDTKSIQGQIADELGLKLEEESLPGRAARLRDQLRDKLKRENRVLLVLDNIWAKLDLEAVGIPLGEEEKTSAMQEEDRKGRNDDHRRCKILLISRREDVLSNDMNTEKNFFIQTLSDKEAGNLFWKTVVNSSGSISIMDLLKYATGWGLFQDVYTMEGGRNRLHTLIDILKASCLLLDYDNIIWIKMHNIIHAVAVSIASTDKLMFNIQIVTGLKEMLEEKLPKDATVVSLPHNDICELPKRLELPKLKLLHMYKNDLNPLRISDSFFEGVKELKVLDLTNFHFSSLPLSLQLLTNLQTLCLDQCVLGDIATIGYLTKLEVLSLLYSDIEHLPGEIRQLTKLRLLDISNCSKLKTITPGIISSLTRLEELYIGNSFVRWDVIGQTNASLTELKQLSHLTTLEIHILDAHIMPQDLFFGKLDRYRIFIGDVWDWFGNYETLNTLKLRRSNIIYLDNGIKTLLNRTEYLYLDELKGAKNVLYELDKEGFQQLKHLHVQKCPEIQYIINSVGLGQSTFSPKLETLFLHNLINLEKMCHGQLEPESFGKLRIVKVEKCDRLKHLFSFSMAKNLLKLQEIEVTDCKKLEEIVFMESKEQVHQNKRTSGTEFSQLRTLTLQSLPQLTSFGFNKFRPNTGYQEIRAEDEHDGCMPSFGQNVCSSSSCSPLSFRFVLEIGDVKMVLLPGLENLKLSSINIECLWLDQLPAMSSCCQTLTSLTLEECSGNLKFLFSYSTVKSLVLLEKLEIRNCKSIEGVINSEEIRGEGKVIKMVFPKLINLQLKGLPNLTQFASGNTVEFPSLNQLSIMDCQKLKTFSSALTSPDIKQSKTVEEMNCQDDIHPFFDKKVELPTLASLYLSSIVSQTIWHNQLQAHSACFHNLTKLTIYGCHNLKYLFPIYVAESLNNLVVLNIWNCKLTERVVMAQDEREISILFPKLNKLNLRDLSELTRFCTFNGNSIELPSLTELIIQDCPKMQTFASNSLPGIEEPEEVNTYTQENLPSFFDEKKLRLRIEDPPRRKHLGGAVLAGIMIYEGTYAMNKNADFETVWEIKEKLCYVRRAVNHLVVELIEVEGDGKADMVFRCIQEMDIDNIMREDAIDDFRVGKILVLIATDVIAHGMDFKGVNCVINYDFPDSAAAYIHRIGRSGRAGRSGEAISFYAEDDIPFLPNIANVMEASGCEVPSWIKALPKLRGKKHRP